MDRRSTNDQEPADAAGDDREGRASGLLRALPDAVLICAVDGTVLEANAEAEKLFGYAADELVGIAVEQLVPAELGAVHRGHRRRYTATSHPRPMITGEGIEALRRDGVRVPVEVNLASVDLPDGPAVVASVRDLTEARRAARSVRAAHDLLSGVLAGATEQAVIATDLDGRIDLFSAGAERMLGWAALEIIGKPVSVLADPDGATDPWGLNGDTGLPSRVRQLAHAAVAGTRPWAVVTRGGERRLVAMSVTVRPGPDGAAGLLLVATDETARQQREATLAASEERFRLVFEDAPIGVALVGLTRESLGVVQRANQALAAMLGRSGEDLVGMVLTSMTHPEDVPLVAHSLDQLASGGSAADPVEHRLLDVRGNEVWVQTAFSVIRDAGRPDYLVAMLNDVTERKRAEAELMHHALHDTLTGLPNRALITESLAGALGRSRRAGTGAGVLYVDLDDFKGVNDSLGHAAGDELLVEVARRLQGCMRDTDVAGRLGGDEFIVVCDGIERLDDITAVAERVSRVLAIRLPIAGELVTVSASIGIAFSPTADADPIGLLRQADIAMYRAKANGRGRYEFADAELQARATRQVQLESELRHALRLTDGASTGGRHAPGAPDGAGGLFLHYQPCFDATTRRVVACEALLRWRHPTRGVLGPGEFLDVAEDRALMVPLGEWVLQAACRQASRWWRDLGDASPEVWVNVSATQLGRHRLVDVVERVLRTTALPAAKLWLELTERQVLSTARATLDDLEAIAELGVRLTVDDFGTGYAGLDYLRRLPVSGLKVDASYVAAIGRDPTGAALAATVVGLGKALDLTVVAEGVETAEQRDVVTELGVDVLQGFLLARPAPPDHVTRMVSAGACGTVQGR